MPLGMSSWVRRQSSVHRPAVDGAGSATGRRGCAGRQVSRPARGTSWSWAGAHALGTRSSPGHSGSTSTSAAHRPIRVPRSWCAASAAPGCSRRNLRAGWRKTPGQPSFILLSEWGGWTLDLARIGAVRAVPGQQLVRLSTGGQDAVRATWQCIQEHPRRCCRGLRRGGSDGAPASPSPAPPRWPHRRQLHGDGLVRPSTLRRKARP